MKVCVSICVFLCVTLVFAASVEEDRKVFQTFKAHFKKVYENAEVEARAFSNFRENLAYIRNSNAQQTGSMRLGLNKFSDLSSEEFTAQRNGFKLNPAHGTDPEHLFEFDPNVAVPSSMDWRAKGAVTHVKNQGQCGSCWSFSTTGSVEGAHFLSTGTLVSLSEQNLIDCSTSYGNEGCNGGLMDYAFQYIINNGGIDTEASYPYQTEGPLQCRYNAANSAATISSYHDIPSGSESALLQAAGTVGPISVAIDASHMSFQSYSGGVYYEPQCSSTQLDHGVLVVGYGTYNGEDYWLVKNSWGADWGLSGYIMMSRNRNNNCGIATSASYPIV